MLLHDKHAAIYGGAGSIGGAVARAFAAEGAEVHLAGRTHGTLEAVAGHGAGLTAVVGSGMTFERGQLDGRVGDARAHAR